MWLTIPETERRELARRLTAKQLDIYRLRLNRCTYEEIAWLLNISIRTVRTHESRARQVHAMLQQEAA